MNSKPEVLTEWMKLSKQYEFLKYLEDSFQAENHRLRSFTVALSNAPYLFRPQKRHWNTSVKIVRCKRNCTFKHFNLKTGIYANSEELNKES